MNIQIDPHTLNRALERGAIEEEIRETLEKGVSISAKGDRLGKSSVFEFQTVRNGKFYEQKRVEVIYVIENETVITVTVYVFFGRWETIS
jgi:hypothetical protein